MPASNRVAIVTGGSSGIGRGICKQLAADGLDVVVADVQREPKRGEIYQTDLSLPTATLIETEYEVTGTFVRTDVSSESDIEQLVEETIAEFGRLDVLVNNAGIIIEGSCQELSREDWQTVVDVNLTAHFLTGKYAIPHLASAEAGRIINISSVTAEFGGAGPAYASTKAGTLNLTRDMATEVADSGTTVNAVLPGVIKTSMQDANDEETRAEQAAKTLLPRLGEPRDVAAAVGFLASPAAEWITGTHITVDGGFLAGGY